MNQSRYTIYHYADEIGTIHVDGERDPYSLDDDEEAADLFAMHYPQLAYGRQLRARHEDWEPSDDQLANGPGMEGGVRY